MSPARSCEPGLSILPSFAQQLRNGFRARLAQRIRLRFAAPFRHRLRKICKQQRKPQPQCDLHLNENPAAWCITPYDQIDVVSTAPTSTTNITGFFIIVRGSSFENRIPHARPTIDRVHNESCDDCAVVVVIHLKSLPGMHQQMFKNRAQAQRRKKVSAPMITITADQQPMKKAAWSPEKFPAIRGTIFFAPDFRQSPVPESSSEIVPINMLNASVMLYHCVLALSPANAEPLLPRAEVYAYRICESPCGPGIADARLPIWRDTTESPENMRIAREKISMLSIAIFTSYDSIFLPRYSGVRPPSTPR